MNAEVSTSRLFRSIAHWRHPLQVATGAAALAALLLLFTPNRYRSEAHILPAEAKPLAALGGQLSAVASTLGLGLPGGDGDDANNLEIVKSRWMADALLETTFEFTTRAWLYGPPRHRQETLYRYLRTRNRDQAVKRLNRMMTFSRDAKSRLLTIAVETRSPELSQQLARKTVTLLEGFLVSKGRTRGGRKAIFAEARMEEARMELGKAEDAFKNFLDRNRNYQVSLDPEIRIRGTRLEMEMKLRQQLLASIALNHESALMEEKNDMPTLNILDTGNLAEEASTPDRWFQVSLAFMAGGLMAMAWRQRHWIRARIKESAALAVKP
jgi:uncharacterized protein involved in exopolysaccharide biosynthesis